MLKKNWQIVAIVVVLAAVGGLGFSGRGCKEEDKQKFEKNLRATVKAGAVGAREFRSQVDDLCKAELLKPESCEKAKPRLEKISSIANRGDKFLTDHPKVTVENRQELLDLVDDLLEEIDGLESDGLIKFKDDESRRKFLLYSALAKSAIRVAKVAIETAPLESAPSPAPSGSQ